MKKIILSALAFLFASGLFAQDIFVNVGGSYIMQSNKTANEGFDNNVIFQDNGNFESETNNFSLGGGIDFGIDIGIRMNDHVAIGLALTYLLGSEIEIANVRLPVDLGVPAIVEGNIVVNATQFRATPFAMLSSGFSDDLSCFVKFGVVVPLAGSTIAEANVTTTVPSLNMTSMSYTKTEAEGQFSIGYSGALGVAFIVNDMISVFGEVRHINLAIKIASDEVTEATEDGVSVLAAMDTYDKMSIYHESLNQTHNTDYVGNYDPDRPHDTLVIEGSFSGVGIGIGVIINLGN